ncbi:hypothetical protein CH373_17990 [Leptospira perolatii]|uniref:NADPH-dependent FMN reductase-like domain-containing protein n=2 Tax=Leptospira perolatii TaxID=2023191 RepID=A0A2M9ZI43_9LEPT|nr:hypothetical protein CH360_17930 [Leptospira perolatii]PJZ71728.1 hypothetical protein CH373_17990 [Leptospira perolatii]
MNVLAISGSLRKNSYNSALLRSAMELQPSGMKMQISNCISELPFFNPDLDSEELLPEKAKTWKHELIKADAVLIASPEYVFEIPGVLKNALDWVVGSGELMNKPVAIWNASPGLSGGQKVHLHLGNTLTVMTATLVKNASLVIPAVNKKVDREGNITDLDLKGLLKKSLEELLLSWTKTKNLEESKT